MNKDKSKKAVQKETADEKIKNLALEIDRVEDEKQEIENQLKKALADYHNLLKNSEKRDEMRFFQMKKNFCDHFIPSLDSLLLAKEASKEVKMDESAKLWFDGLLATIDSLNKGMQEVGLKQYVPEKGSQFNNEIHEAVAMVEDGEKGKIFDVIQPGYTLDDSVIRPARVIVSK